MSEDAFDPKPYADVEKVPLRVEKKNVKLGKLLLPALYGEGGELTSFLSYTYHSARFSELQPEVSQALQSIAEVERGHLDTLCRLCTLLGADPKPRVESRMGPIYWSGAYARCEGRLARFLNLAVRQERQAIKEYERLMGKTQDEYVAVTLQCMMLDERIHLSMLEKLYENYCK